MGIAVIAIVDICQHFIEVWFLTFAYEFVKATLCAHFGRSSKEEFEFRFREDNCTDISSIHDDTFGDAHGLLLRYKEGTHFFDLRDPAGAVTHFERTDEGFHIFSVERDMLRAIYENESDLNMRQSGNYIRFVGEALTQGI